MTPEQDNRHSLEVNLPVRGSVPVDYGRTLEIVDGMLNTLGPIREALSSGRIVHVTLVPETGEEAQAGISDPKNPATQG